MVKIDETTGIDEDQKFQLNLILSLVDLASLKLGMHTNSGLKRYK